MRITISERSKEIGTWAIIVYLSLAFCYLAASYQLGIRANPRISFNLFELLFHFHQSLQFLGLGTIIIFLLIFVFIVGVFPYKKSKTVPVAVILCCITLSHFAGMEVARQCGSNSFLEAKYEDFVADGGSRNPTYELFEKADSELSRNNEGLLGQCQRSHFEILRVSYGDDYFREVFEGYD